MKRFTLKHLLLVLFFGIGNVAFADDTSHFPDYSLTKYSNYQANIVQLVRSDGSIITDVELAVLDATGECRHKLSKAHTDGIYYLTVWGNKWEFLDLECYYAGRVRKIGQIEWLNYEVYGKPSAPLLYTVSDVEEDALTITTAQYATLYLDHEVIVPDGVKAGIVTDVTDKQLSVDWRFAAGSVVPAYTALLLNAEEELTEATSYDLETPKDPQEAYVTGNLLRGTLTDSITQGGNLYYKLAAGTNGKAGFYWAEDDGAAFTNAAGKAYLALTAEQAQQAKQAKSFVFDWGGTPTAITTLPGEADAANATADAGHAAAIYTLDGRCVQTPRKGSLYIVNGKKFISK